MTLEDFLTALFTMQPATGQFYDSKRGHQWHEDNIRAHMARLVSAPAPGADTPNPHYQRPGR